MVQWLQIHLAMQGIHLAMQGIHLAMQGIHLAMQGTPAPSLTQEDPTYSRATKPVTPTTEPGL